MKCDWCEASNPEGASKCYRCGINLPTPEESAELMDIVRKIEADPVMKREYLRDPAKFLTEHGIDPGKYTIEAIPPAWVVGIINPTIDAALVCSTNCYRQCNAYAGVIVGYDVGVPDFTLQYPAT